MNRRGFLASLFGAFFAPRIKPVDPIVQAFARTGYTSVTQKELLKNGMMGDIWSSSIYVSSTPKIRLKDVQERRFHWIVDAEL